MLIICERFIALSNDCVVVNPLDDIVRHGLHTVFLLCSIFIKWQLKRFLVKFMFLSKILSLEIELFISALSYQILDVVNEVPFLISYLALQAEIDLVFPDFLHEGNNLASDDQSIEHLVV